MSESSKNTERPRGNGFVAWWSSTTGTAVALGVVVVVAIGVLFGQLSTLGIWEPWESDEIRVAREWAARDEAPEQIDEESGARTAERLGVKKAEKTSKNAENAQNSENSENSESSKKQDKSGEKDQKSPNWVTPTLNGKPVASPLVKTWILASQVGTPAKAGQYKIGELERSARIPFAVMTFALSLLAFFWVRRYFGTWPAFLGVMAFITSPAIFLGTHTLSTEMLFVVFSSLAVMSFFQLTRAATARERWLWGIGCGVALALSFLEGRFFGLLSPLAVIVAFGVAELPFEQVERARQKPSGVASLVSRVDIGLAVAALLGVGATLLWSINRSSGVEDAYFLPHVRQWIAMLVPLFILLSGVFLARQTRVGRSIWSLPALVGALICVVTVVVVTQAYGDVNPLRLVDGDISGEIPLFSFLLDNRLSGASAAAEHMYFAMWVREIGFSLLPWIALVPLGLGYLSLATRVQDDEGEPLENILSARASFQRLLLVWSFTALAVVGLASGFNHHYYPAYLPLLLGVGLMLGDSDFFRSIRLKSLAPYAMGFAAVAIIMMLGKDLERFPQRFMEPYLSMQEKSGLPDDFSFGSTLKAIKYGWAALLATFFFGLVSGVGLLLRDIKQVPAKFKAWRGRRALKKAQNLEANTAGAASKSDGLDADERSEAVETSESGAASQVVIGDENQVLNTTPGTVNTTPGTMNTTPGTPITGRERAEMREAYRAESGLLPRLSALVESPQTWVCLVLVAALVTAGIFLYSFAPEQSLHLSQRGIFETYTQLAQPDEPLYRYGASSPQESVYLGNIEAISKVEAFTNRLDDPERYFVIMPRDQLAQINYDVRRRNRQNLAVLDASSSQLLLVSNQLKDGETQQNFVADHIIENPEDFAPAMPLQFADKGMIKPPTFDEALELIGWDINQKQEDGSFPEFKWGDTLKLTLYFKVKRRVTGAQKIFMHIDRGGSRLHGDHDPADGEFPTNYWLPGDIVKDEFSLPVESYTTPGVYTIWMGFYRNNNRMKVQPSQAHDGQNRVRVGQLRVSRM